MFGSIGDLTASEKKNHESDQTEWEHKSALRGLNANAGAQVSALPWSFFLNEFRSARAFVTVVKSSKYNLSKTAVYMSRAGWLSRYRSEFQPTELAGMSCDHKVDFHGV